MSVLITGMKMPETCGLCPYLHWCDKRYCGEKPKRGDECPLVEIPKPHGRLIDADALQLEAYHMMFHGHADDRDVAFVNFNLGKAPTIIESEEGDP